MDLYFFFTIHSNQLKGICILRKVRNEDRDRIVQTILIHSDKQRISF